MTRKRLMTIGGPILLVLVLVALVGWRTGLLGSDDPPPTRLAEAMALAPDSAVRFSWTDWAAVRREVGLDLDASSTGALLQDLLDRGYDRDLTSTSALVSSAPVLQAELGFSPASLDWELYSQAPGAASLLMRPGPSVSYDAVRAGLRATGYDEPDTPDGLWVSDPESDAITARVTAELLYVALDEDRDLIVASDTEAAARAALAAAQAGDSGDAGDSGPVPTDAVVAAGDAVSAALYSGDQACSALAMGNADPADQAAGEALVSAAGKVNPLTGLVIADEPEGGVRVVMSFANEDQARTNADTRATLAAGPAPGQGGDFSERFTLGEVAARGDLVTMELQPVEGAFVLSDLSNGPLLFATC